MSANKKYYWMKLKENFFDSEEMVLLESMQDGFLYSNILIKMYLKSLKGDGRLMLNDRIPYNPAMIATLTRHQVGTVEKALDTFAQLGLIEILDNQAIYMMDIQALIGEGSSEADRKKAYRERIKNERILITDGVDVCPDIRPQSKSKELDLDSDLERDVYTPDDERINWYFDIYRQTIGKQHRKLKSELDCNPMLDGIDESDFKSMAYDHIDKYRDDDNRSTLEYFNAIADRYR